MTILNPYFCVNNTEAIIVALDYCQSVGDSPTWMDEIDLLVEVIELSEANEIAKGMLPDIVGWKHPITVEKIRRFVKEQMPGETQAVIDNVTWCVYQHVYQNSRY